MKYVNRTYLLLLLILFLGTKFYIYLLVENGKLSATLATIISTVSLALLIIYLVLYFSEKYQE